MQREAGFLTSAHRQPLRLPDPRVSGVREGRLPVTVAGPCRTFTGLPFYLLAWDQEHLSLSLYSVGYIISCAGRYGKGPQRPRREDSQGEQNEGNRVQTAG